MRELEKKYKEQLEMAQEEATIKMEELEQALQSKVAREAELEQEREVLRTEAEETKVYSD